MKRKPRTVSYLRVSTIQQDTEKNKKDVRAYANKKDFGKVEFIEEKTSGKIPWKDRKIKALIDELQAGDNLPYGRTFDRKAEIWGIDEDKKKKIEYAAERYLAGEPIDKIAKDVGLASSGLWRILTQRADDKWNVHFKIPRFKIDETVTMTVPRLLDDGTIEAIKLRIEGNRTFCKGQLKNKYLLSRVLFCAECGYSLFGMKAGNNARRYRHTKETDKGCKFRFSIRARDIEQTVLVQVFSMMGDLGGMEQAMLKAIPDSSKVDKLRARQTYLEKELAKAEASRNRIIKSIGQGIIEQSEAAAVMGDIRTREASHRLELEGVNAELRPVPTVQQISQRVKLIKRQLSEIYGSPGRLTKMTFEQKRELISNFFSGKDTQGRRLGVYVFKTPDGSIKYEIRGILNRVLAGSLKGDSGPRFQDFESSDPDYIEKLFDAANIKLTLPVI